MNQENKRPNEHRAWFIDQSVINFLWAKGWSCCKVEACDWWHFVNENLKKDLFTSEKEWKDFKCWNSSKYQWYPEKLLTYTLKKVSENHV